MLTLTIDQEMPLKKKVAGMCEKNLYLRHLYKMSVSLITGYLYDQRVEIISSEVAIPNAFGIPAIVALKPGEERQGR